MRTLTCSVCRKQYDCVRDDPFCPHLARIIPSHDLPASQESSNANPSIWDLVIADMGARDRLGWENYGKPLRGHNGRDMLRDAYEEALDLACYLRGAIWERDNPKVPRG